MKITKMVTIRKVARKTLEDGMGLAKDTLSDARSAVKTASTKVVNRVARLSGVKKWEFEIKKIDKAHDFLTDYYHNTEFGDLHYGAFGMIDLKKIDKSRHGRLYTNFI